MNLYNFVLESNKIEGIIRDPTQPEMEQLYRFISTSKLTLQDLKEFVAIYEPEAVFREYEDVPTPTIGGRLGFASGPTLRLLVEQLLDDINADASLCPVVIHHRYEQLHPFTDCNGRSGRAIWLKMIRDRSKTEYSAAVVRGFLRHWYYQTLERGLS